MKTAVLRIHTVKSTASVRKTELKDHVNIKMMIYAIFFGVIFFK